MRTESRFKKQSKTKPTLLSLIKGSESSIFITTNIAPVSELENVRPVLIFRLLSAISPMRGCLHASAMPQPPGSSQTRRHVFAFFPSPSKEWKEFPIQTDKNRQITLMLHSHL